MSHLRNLSVRGYRSLADVSLTDIGRVTVLIGPNGAGKSNLLDFLRMLSFLHSGSLRRFVGEAGGATALLHYGPSATASIHLELEYEVDGGRVGYRAELAHAANDSLFFAAEEVAHRPLQQAELRWESLGEGHVESRLSEANGSTARTVRWCLQRTTFLHVHDTSTRSPMRQNSRIADAQYLRSNGSNLAAYLLALRDGKDSASKVAWHRINHLVRRVAPSVKELLPSRPQLQPLESEVQDGQDVETATTVRLDWVDDQDQIFGPAALSDGTLRAIALITALSQPTSRLPLLLAIDEPELGLHPTALELICEIIQSVAHHMQVVLATQSPVLIDHFEPEDVVITERADRSTRLRRLHASSLQRWLDDYSLSELYEKNVLGGLP
jgi:predicted ATPase